VFVDGAAMCWTTKAFPGDCGYCVFVESPCGPDVYPHSVAWDLRVSVVCFFAPTGTACLQNLFPPSHTLDCLVSQKLFRPLIWLDTLSHVTAHH